MLRITKRYCHEAALQYEHFHAPAMFGYDLRAYAAYRKLDFLAYTNADLKYINIPANSLKGFHIVRDPRDMIVSAYFSHLYSHSIEYWPELEQYRSRLKRLDHDEGLFYVMDYMPRMVIDGDTIAVFDQMMNWDYNQANILEIRFEDLVTSPYYGIVQIFEFLGLIEDNTLRQKHPLVLKLVELFIDLLDFSMKTARMPFQIGKKKLKLEELLRIIYRNDFKRISSGRGRGQEDSRHHFRKGIPGDWKNHFNKEHKRVFKERYNSLLVKLQYEKDDRW